MRQIITMQPAPRTNTSAISYTVLVFQRWKKAGPVISLACSNGRPLQDAAYKLQCPLEIVLLNKC